MAKLPGLERCLKVVILEQEGGLGLCFGNELVVPILAHVTTAVADAQLEHPDQLITSSSEQIGTLFKQSHQTQIK